MARKLEELNWRHLLDAFSDGIEVGIETLERKIEEYEAVIQEIQSEGVDRVFPDWGVDDADAICMIEDARHEVFLAINA